MEKQNEPIEKIEHFNDWGRKTFEICTRYIEYKYIHSAPAKQFLTTISPKRPGQDKKNMYTKSMAGLRKTTTGHSSSGQSLAAA